jgi:hypothetical protein
MVFQFSVQECCLPHPHPLLEAKLAGYIAHTGDEYIVMNGPKGAGKTTLVNHIASKESSGIISLKLQKNSITDFYEAFAEQVCGSKDVFKPNSLDPLLYTASELGRKLRSSTDWVPTPTIIVEADKAVTGTSTHQIARDIILLCVDAGVCRGIIVLSDVFAALALPQDPRVAMIRVDDFSIVQANEYLDNRGYLTHDAACRTVSANECDLNDINRTLRQLIFDSMVLGRSI